MTNKYLGANWFSPIVLATILATGAAIVWAGGIVWAVFIAEQLFSQRQPSESLALTIDGRALLRSYHPNKIQPWTYRTLDGQSVEVSEIELQNVNSQVPAPSKHSRYLPPWNQRVVGFAQMRGIPTYWYLMHDGQSQGHAYFVIFDPNSRGKIGYFGLCGFRPGVAPLEERFAIDSLLLPRGAYASESFSWGGVPTASPEDVPVVFVTSNESLFRVDLQRQSIRPILLPDKVLAVSHFSEPIAVEDEERFIYKRRIAVRLPDRILWLSLEGETLHVVPLPKEIREASLSMYGTTGPDSILVSNTTAPQSPTEIYWITGEGGVARHETLRLDQPPQDRRLAMWMLTGVLPSPGIQTLGALTLGPWEEMEQNGITDYSTALVHSLGDTWPPLLAVYALSTILAVVCYRHYRSYDKTGGLVWAAFVLVLGVPGLVGYWLHRRWPATERCPHCGATVPRDRENCLACAAEFPAPALKGIEVFA